ncbi:nucleopolyhedrovirus P10 family protein [Streptomyces sp. NPDC047072]|uniref:nucleopolyhedrovirus P10 family protein n=1 Tax=Streptomyces sp. NPDC047072 TaxID=3154809 RepID=UPI0033F3B4C4
MTADPWTRSVRHQLGLGRLLPLGGARDGAWISEETAGEVLRGAVSGTDGVRLGALRIGLADPEEVRESAVPPPPSALPPGPLRISAEFEATPVEPLPVQAAWLRAALAAASEQLGLTVVEVDLRVTALLDDGVEPAPVRQSRAPRAVAAPGDGDEGRAAAAVLAVPGAACLTSVLGRPVHIEERESEGALPRRHVRVELAVDTDHRALDVAREVRTAVGGALADHPTVAVLVTGVA